MAGGVVMCRGFSTWLILLSLFAGLWSEHFSVLCHHLTSCFRTWLTDNKPSLHLGKTESILFGTRHSVSEINVNDFKIKIDDTVISSKEEII